MALLEKAKKASDEKDDKKKKHKHPAAKVSPQPEGDGAEGEDSGTAQQPDSGADDSGSEGAPEAGAGASDAPVQAQQGDGGADQGSADASAGQENGGQPTQGTPPVPSPAAPGAGDTTSGREDTPDPGQDQDPNAQPPETPGENTAAGPGSNSDLQQVPMSPGLKDEYDKANDLLMQLLYKSGDDKLATGLLQGLVPQGPGKIKNTAMLAITVLMEIHKRLGEMPPQILLIFAKDVTAHVMSLGEQVKQIQYSDQDSTAILGAVYEGAMRIFGVNKGQVRQVAHHVGRSVMHAHQQKYLQAHAHAKPAMDAANASWHHDHLAPQQGAPQDAGPQTGAPVGAQSAPTSGAPPQPPTPAATPEQGMLSQAAQEGAQ